LTQVVALREHHSAVQAKAFWNAYAEHQERLRLVGLQGPCLARTDNDDHVLVDFAACLTIMRPRPNLVLTARSLRQLKTFDMAAFRVLAQATTAYFSSRELRAELGQPATRSFEQLQEAISGAA
jgi:hypothetical protein